MVYGVWWAKPDRPVEGQPEFATYSSWDLAFPRTVGVRGVKYKKFPDREAARAGMGVPGDADDPPHDPPPPAPKKRRPDAGPEGPAKRARGAALSVFTDGGVWGQGTSMAAAGWGVAAERWLFFAEAEHVSQLYYGATRA